MNTLETILQFMVIYGTFVIDLFIQECSKNIEYFLCVSVGLSICIPCWIHISYTYVSLYVHTYTHAYAHI